jgi:hypothetical protein
MQQSMLLELEAPIKICGTLGFLCPCVVVDGSICLSSVLCV